jgi:chromosome segregation ATPase
MAEMIEQLIGEIRERSREIKRNLSAERENSKNLVMEKTVLSAEIEHLKSELKAANDKINDLKGEMEAMAARNIEQPAERKVTQEEIDDLVKEIDYCITQLKR